MTDLAKLVVRLEAETARYQAELQKAQRKLSGFRKSSSDDLIKLGKQFGALAATAGIGLATMTKMAINQADQFSKLSAQVGIGTESLQALAYAAQLNGTEIAALTTGLNRFNRSVVDADDGAKKQAASFGALNVRLRDTDGRLKGTETLLLDVADAFAQSEDNAAKSAIAQELFGRAGASMIPFLNQGRSGIEALKDEAEALGIIMDERAARAAEQFNDNLTRLTQAGRGLFVQLAESVLPTLTRLSDEFIETTTQGNSAKDMARGLDSAFRVAVTAGISLFSVIKAAGKALGAFAAVAQVVGEAGVFDPTRGGLVGALIRKDDRARLASAGGIIKDAYTDIADDVAGSIAQIQKLWGEQGQAQRDEVEQTGAAVRRSLEAPVSADALETHGKALESLMGMASDLQQQLATADMGESAVIRYRIAHGDLAQVIADAGAQGEAYAQTLINLTEDLEMQAAATQLAADRQADHDRIVQEGAAIVEATRTPLERYMSTVQRLNELAAQGAIDQDTYNRAVFDAQDALDASAKKADVWAVAMDEAARSAASNVQSSLADFLFDPFEDGLRGMLRSFTEMLQRMAAQAAAAGIINSVIGQSAGALGGLFGGGGPTLSPSLSVPIDAPPGRERGGPVRAGGLYEVNEGGVPELLSTGGRQYLMMAREPGNVTPLVMPPSRGAQAPQAGAAAPGNLLININNQSGTPISAQQVSSRLMPNGDRQVGIIIKDIGEGGPVSRAIERTFGLSRRGSY